MQCRYCGVEVEDTLAVCPNCQASLQEWFALESEQNTNLQMMGNYAEPPIYQPELKRKKIKINEPLFNEEEGGPPAKTSFKKALAFGMAFILLFSLFGVGVFTKYQLPYIDEVVEQSMNVHPRSAQPQRDPGAYDEADIKEHYLSGEPVMLAALPGIHIPQKNVEEIKKMNSFFEHYAKSDDLSSFSIEGINESAYDNFNKKEMSPIQHSWTYNKSIVFNHSPLLNSYYFTTTFDILNINKNIFVMDGKGEIDVISEHAARAQLYNLNSILFYLERPEDAEEYEDFVDFGLPLYCYANGEIREIAPVVTNYVVSANLKWILFTDGQTMYLGEFGKTAVPVRYYSYMKGERIVPLGVADDGETLYYSEGGNMADVVHIASAKENGFDYVLEAQSGIAEFALNMNGNEAILFDMEFCYYYKAGREPVLVSDGRNKLYGQLVGAMSFFEPCEGPKAVLVIARESFEDLVL